MTDSDMHGLFLQITIYSTYHHLGRFQKIFMPIWALNLEHIMVKLNVITTVLLAYMHLLIRGRPESSSFSSMIITIVRGGVKNDEYYHNFFSMRKVPLLALRQKWITVLAIYCSFDSCQSCCLP